MMEYGQVQLLPLLKDDPDREVLRSISVEPSVSRFLSVAENYFDYVTGTENVFYLKIVVDGVTVGGIHYEYEDDGTSVSLSVCVGEAYRRRGYARTALSAWRSALPPAVRKIDAFIEEENLSSRALFSSLGFAVVGKEDGLLQYEWKKGRAERTTHFE